MTDRRVALDPVHHPTPDRLLGPPVAPLVHAAGPAATCVLSLLSLAAAGAALLLFLRDAPRAAGAVVILAALLDAAAGRVTPDGHEPGERRRLHALAVALDTFADRAGDTLVIGGAAAWSHLHERYPAPLAAGMVALIGCLGLGYIAVRAWASAGRTPAERLFGRWWMGRDLRLLILAAGALAGTTYAALIAVAVLGNLPVAWGLVRLPDDLRDSPRS